MAASAAGQRMLQQRLQLPSRCRVLTDVHLRLSQQQRLVSVVAAAAAADAEAAEPAAVREQRAFTCVRLRGLPYDVSEEEVSALLGAAPVDFFCVNREGRFSGEAFVVLSSEQQVEAALGKHKSNMGKRYVEVFRARRAEYYRAIAAELHGDNKNALAEKANRAVARPLSPSSSSSSSEGDPDGMKVLLLRGLPFKAQKEDIVDWFASVAALGADDVRIIQDRGRPNGTALVRFASAEDAQQAAAAKHMQSMGSRYIEVFPCSRDDVQRYMARSY